MELYLVRHGEATDTKTDPEQPLSPKGIADVDRLARYLRDNMDLKVGAFYHSPKKRAMQTAAIIKNTIYPSAELNQRDYLNPDDPLTQIEKDIAGWGGGSAMIVGHMPFLSRLAARLTVGDENRMFLRFPTSSLVILERDSSGLWSVTAMLTLQMILDR